jgi:hypothetical protein
VPNDPRRHGLAPRAIRPPRTVISPETNPNPELIKTPFLQSPICPLSLGTGQGLCARTQSTSRQAAVKASAGCKAGCEPLPLFPKQPGLQKSTFPSRFLPVCRLPKVLRWHESESPSVQVRLGSSRQAWSGFTPTAVRIKVFDVDERLRQNRDETLRQAIRVRQNILEMVLYEISMS